MSDHAGILLVIMGLVTASAVALAFAPDLGLRLVFGKDGPDAVTTTIARHWGLLLALVGGLMIYAGYHPEIQTPVMVVAATEKIAVGLMFGIALPRSLALKFVIAADAAMALVCLFLLFT